MPNMPSSSSPVALFITGPSGCGKTTLAEAWVRSRLLQSEPWTLLDKDVVSGRHGPRILSLLGADPHDRDSPVYKEALRDMDYAAALDVAAAQLSLGGSVVLPGPWTRELQDGRLFSAARMGLPEVRVVVVRLSLPCEERHRRIQARGHFQDGWKLSNWDACLAAAPVALPLCTGQALTEMSAAAPLCEQVEMLAALLFPRIP